MTYLTAEKLGERLHYNPRYIRDYLVDKVFQEGVHYVRPFGRRRILFIWEAIEQDMRQGLPKAMFVIPLARGGVCNG